MRRRNRGRGKHGKLTRGYLGSYQLSQYQGFRYKYHPINSTVSNSTSYPLPDYNTTKPLTSRGAIPHKAPIVDWNRCVGCGTCVQNCPVDAIELIAEKANINPQKCIRCGICSRVCPHNAIH